MAGDPLYIFSNDWIIWAHCSDHTCGGLSVGGDVELSFGRNRRDKNQSPQEMSFTCLAPCKVSVIILHPLLPQALQKNPSHKGMSWKASHEEVEAFFAILPHRCTNTHLTTFYHCPSVNRFRTLTCSQNKLFSSDPSTGMTHHRNDTRVKTNETTSSKMLKGNGGFQAWTEQN